MADRCRSCPQQGGQNVRFSRWSAFAVISIETAVSMSAAPPAQALAAASAARDSWSSARENGGPARRRRRV
jgi:hypothetical protein